MARLFRVFRKGRFALIPALACLGIFIHSAYAQDERIIYVPQTGTPTGISNFVQSDSGCNWAGIGGQVFDRQGDPIVGLVVKLEGTIEGQNILIYAVTGGALQFGPGGFLMKIADRPVASNGNLSLQLLDITGTEKSAPFKLSTVADCGHNLLLINIKELLSENEVYLPLVRR